MTEGKSTMKTTGLVTRSRERLTAHTVRAWRFRPRFHCGRTVTPFTYEEELLRPCAWGRNVTALAFSKILCAYERRLHAVDVVGGFAWRQTELGNMARLECVSAELGVANRQDQTICSHDPPVFLFGCAVSPGYFRESPQTPRAHLRIAWRSIETQSDWGLGV